MKQIPRRDHEQKKIRRFREGSFVVIVMVALLLPTACTRSATSSLGFGAYPVTTAHYAAWAISHEDTSRKSLAFLVYAVGRAGWHGQSRFAMPAVRVTADPLEIVLPGSPDDMRIQYDRNAGTIGAGNTTWALERDNVFVVTNADGDNPRLEGLGRFVLDFTPGENPSTALLRDHARLRVALAGKSPDGRDLRKRPSKKSAAMEERALYLLSLQTDAADKKAYSVLKTVAEGGAPRAQFNLGVCYQLGRGVQKNEARANEWYKKAAAQDHVDAQFKLGYSYEVGRGVDRDQVASYTWYEAAALNGDTVSQFRIGQRLRDGLGVERNRVRAHAWLTVVGEQAFRFSATDRKQIESETRALRESLSPEQLAEARTLANGYRETLATIRIHRLAY